MRRRRKFKKKGIVPILLIVFILVYNTYYIEINKYISGVFERFEKIEYNFDIPKYNGEKYVVLNGNIPGFSESDITSESFEVYSSRDFLGRCKVAYANIGKDLMPTKERESIGGVKPTGWHTVKYDIVDGKYLYNRCHLIGYQLSGENANPENLITCTRSMNVDGMLPFENKIKEYIDKTNNHVLYRVTPVFEGNNLLASGVQLEALSVEDNGEGIKFNMFVFNVQDGININYKDGSSSLIE